MIRREVSPRGAKKKKTFQESASSLKLLHQPGSSLAKVQQRAPFFSSFAPLFFAAFPPGAGQVLKTTLRETFLPCRKLLIMTVQEIMAELKAMGSETTRNTLINHGGPANQFGVRVGDLKKIQKKVKKNYELSLELYDTGISDAQYLAGLIADEKRMTKKDLQHWADTAVWHMQSEYTVPWIAAESNYGWELALKWIDSKKESIQSSGWATLASLAAIKNDDELDLKEWKNLLKRVEKDIHSSANKVRYVMNSFVIATGCYITALSGEAQKTARAIGKVSVNMGNTACKVLFAPDYIQKVIDKGYLGKKKKMARC